MLPHPVNAIMSLEQRRNDLLVESARDRRARLAERGSSIWSRRSVGRLFAVVTFVVMLALLIAASATVVIVSPAVLP